MQLNLRGWLYTNLSENTFKNHRNIITNSKYDWTISDYLYQNFRMKIGEKMACLSCHQNKSPEILKENYFILLFDIITLDHKQIPICHNKITHLFHNCAMMKELLDKFHENQS